MESGKNIGEVFKEKLYDYSEEPSNQVWGNIQNNPDLIKFNKNAGFNPIKYIIGGAAIIVLSTIALVAYNYFPIENTNSNIAKTETAIPKTETQNIQTNNVLENKELKNTTKLPSNDNKNLDKHGVIEPNNLVNYTPKNNSPLIIINDLNNSNKNEFVALTKTETNETKTPINTNVTNRSESVHKSVNETTPSRTIKNVIPIVASHDTIICLWSGINLSVGGATSVIWSNGSNANQIYVEPSESTVFSARVTNSEGNDTTIKVFVQVVDCFQIYMPTAFTPDGDGLNDEFKAVYNGNINDFEMMVFTRSGKKVFESSDINFGWDGKINGSQIEEGAYFYVIRYKDATDKVKEQTGQVILYRSR